MLKINVQFVFIAFKTFGMACEVYLLSGATFCNFYHKSHDSVFLQSLAPGVM